MSWFGGSEASTLYPVAQLNGERQGKLPGDSGRHVVTGASGKRPRCEGHQFGGEALIPFLSASPGLDSKAAQYRSEPRIDKCEAKTNPLLPARGEEGRGTTSFLFSAFHSLPQTPIPCGTSVVALGAPPCPWEADAEPRGRGWKYSLIRGALIPGAGIQSLSLSLSLWNGDETRALSVEREIKTHCRHVL